MSLFHIAYKIAFIEGIAHITVDNKNGLNSTRNQFRMNRKRDGAKYTVQTTFYIEDDCTLTRLLSKICNDFNEICKLYKVYELCYLEIDMCLVNEVEKPTHRYCKLGYILPADS